ncbi:MAG: hypothetical protein JO257_21450 [Deltaproteobacteria bacterium]|nr:hypothetical protein [Deltaproteobacteria bacterium]
MRKTIGLLLFFAACTDGGGRGDDNGGGGTQNPPAATGQGETVFTAGSDASNPFFASLGTNLRTCASCHDETAGWSLTPALLQTRFNAGDGTDPVFRSVDGTTSPTADTSTAAARQTSYALLLQRGLIRVGKGIPEGAEFTLASVSDPYGFATAAELSLFRRPLPSTNLGFLSQIMWDTREATLATQATDATTGHAQAMGVDTTQIDQIVAFESSIYTAQRSDDVAGDLAEGGGGAQALSTQALLPGSRNAFTLYGAWANVDTSTAEGQRRASIARGERIFNTEPINIQGVAGLPDQRGSCSTCHDRPNVGDHATAVPMNIGVADANQRTDNLPGLPRYTFRNTTTGATVTITDPGLALVTGKWADIGRFKIPVLRGVAMRPPYFHNGFANDLRAVVQFYRQRFNMRLSDQEETDLVNFLSAL